MRLCIFKLIFLSFIWESNLSFIYCIFLLFMFFFFLQSPFQHLFWYPWISHKVILFDSWFLPPVPLWLTIYVSCYILTSSTCSLFTFALSPLRMHHLWIIFSNVLTVISRWAFFSHEVQITLIFYVWAKLRMCPHFSISREMFHGRFSYSSFPHMFEKLLLEKEFNHCISSVK